MSKNKSSKNSLSDSSKSQNNSNNISMIKILSGVFRMILLHHLKPEENKKPLSIKLNAEGVSPALVEKSLNWLQKFFSYTPEAYEKIENNFNLLNNRIYAPQEITRISLEGRNFLSELTAQGILSAPKREFLMDCIMGEEIDPLSLSQLQFLTFIVLSQDCKRPEEVWWLEDIVLKQDSELTTLAN
jgi:Smg protein